METARTFSWKEGPVSRAGEDVLTAVVTGSRSRIDAQREATRSSTPRPAIMAGCTSKDAPESATHGNGPWDFMRRHRLDYGRRPVASEDRDRVPRDDGWSTAAAH